MKTMLVVFLLMIAAAIGARFIQPDPATKTKPAAMTPATLIIEQPAPKPTNTPTQEPAPIYQMLHAHYAERFGMQKEFGKSRLEPTVKFHSIFKSSLPELLFI